MAAPRQISAAALTKFDTDGSRAWACKLPYLVTVLLAQMHAVAGVLAAAGDMGHDEVRAGSWLNSCAEAPANQIHLISATTFILSR